MAKEFIREVKPHAKLYRDNLTGIAWIADGNTGCGHSVHANISASGSVRGMKNLGYWQQKDRCVRSHGFIYNIDTYVVDDELDKIVADECMCIACAERRASI